MRVEGTQRRPSLYIAPGGANRPPPLNNYPGWLAGIITEHECGYAAPPDDPVAFANALIHAADHRDELRRMGQRARALAQSEYNRDLLAARFVTWLEKAVERKG